MREMFVKVDEVSITPVLNDCDSKFKQHVTLGSYPDFINRCLYSLTTACLFNI